MFPFKNYLVGLLQFLSTFSAVCLLSLYAGHLGKMHFNKEGSGSESDKKWLQLFDAISKGQNPTEQHTMSIEKAIWINENIVYGERKWQKLKNALDPIVLLPSCYQLRQFRADYHPKLGTHFSQSFTIMYQFSITLLILLEKFMNGVWHDLEDCMKSSMSELVLVQDIQPEDLPDNELHVEVLLGTDSSGSHKQFGGKDIEIDSRNLEYGKGL